MLNYYESRTKVHVKVIQIAKVCFT